jgi:uncharacterized membrane protein YqjE
MVREEPPGDRHPVGLIESLKGLARSAIEILHTRLDLLVTEIAEEQARLLELALLAALALLAFFLAIIFVAFLIVAAFWDTPYRLWAPGLIAVALVAVGAWLWRVLRNKARATGKAFAATLQELTSDIEHLR